MRKACQKGHLGATDGADYLVEHKNFAFRDAYYIIKKLVTYADFINKDISELSLDEIRCSCKELKTIDKDIDREKSIVIDANSNEKRLKEEKNDLTEIDSKYYETEKLSNEDLEIAKAKLKNEQEKVDIILEAFNSENLKKNINLINEIKDNIIKAKNCIDEQKINDAQILLDECQISLSLLIQNIAGDEDNNKISKIMLLR